MLGEVVIDDERVLALLHEVFAHSAACVWCYVLERCKLCGGSGNYYRVVHSACISELLNYGSDGRSLLTDRNVDTEHICISLVDYRIDCDSGLTCLSVANDKLTLTASYRDHRVDSLDTCLERGIYRLSCDDTGCYSFYGAVFVRNDRSLAVDRFAESVYNASEKCVAYRNGYDLTRSLYVGTFLYVGVGAEHNRTYKILLKVESHALHTVVEFEKLVYHTVLESVDTNDTVSDGDYRTRIGESDL